LPYLAQQEPSALNIDLQIILKRKKNVFLFLKIFSLSFSESIDKRIYNFSNEFKSKNLEKKFSIFNILYVNSICIGV